jgi:hypothetical protein
MKSSSAYLLEVLQVPLVVFAWPVTGEVVGLLVLDDLSADMELLQALLAKIK